MALLPRLQLLQRLDMSLPLAMASKARVRFKLAQVAEKSMPQEAIQLYQLALDETDIVWLGGVLCMFKSLK
jgi:hypothetical protein